MFQENNAQKDINRTVKKKNCFGNEKNHLKQYKIIIEYLRNNLNIKNIQLPDQQAQKIISVYLSGVIKKWKFYLNGKLWSVVNYYQCKSYWNYYISFYLVPYAVLFVIGEEETKENRPSR